jgi:hypothetical protein
LCIGLGMRQGHWVRVSSIALHDMDIYIYINIYIHTNIQAEQSWAARTVRTSKILVSIIHYGDDHGINEDFSFANQSLSRLA